MDRNDQKYQGLADNKNAEKWTEGAVTAMLQKFVEKAEKGDKYLIINIITPDIDIDQYDYLKKKYADNPTVFRLFKKIEIQAEANLTRAALAGEVKETMSIFLLKAKYGYVDKQQVEIEHKGTINVHFDLQRDNDELDNDIADLIDPT